MQPVTVSVSAPVILSVLRDGEQDDRYRKVRQEPSQAAGRIHAAMIRVSFPAFILSLQGVSFLMIGDQEEERADSA